MGAVLDWTSDGVFIDPASALEIEPVMYRVESSGVIRWKGIVEKLAAYAVGAVVGFPVQYMPVYGETSNTYIDWTGAPADLNVLISGPAMSCLIYANPGATIDLSAIAWQTTPLPVVEAEHTLEGVLAGLKGSLENIAKLRVYDFPSSKVEPPAAVLSLPETPYDVTLGGRSDVWTFPLWILVSKGDDRSAYKEMIPYLDAEGERSIRAMVEADRTLGGACDTCAVVNARPQFASVGGVEFLAIEFTLEVFT